MTRTTARTARSGARRPASRRKPKSPTPWRDKLERRHASHGKIEPLPERMQKGVGPGTMLIPRPLDVDAVMASVPRGRLITTDVLRERLARAAGATVACPLTSGIFMRIAAEAAEEDRRAGRPRVTPWWRTVRANGALIDRFPGAPAVQAQLLRAEGVEVTPTSGRGSPRVVDLARHLLDA